MATLPTTYAIVHARYPEAEAAITAKLRAGTSQHRDAEASSLAWSFCYHEKEREVTLDEANSSIETALRDQVARTTACIQASIHKFWTHSDNIPVPIELISKYRQIIERDRSEKARIRDMSAYEREQETDEIDDLLFGRRSGR